MRKRPETIRIAAMGLVHAALAAELGIVGFSGSIDAMSHESYVHALEGHWSSCATPCVGSDSTEGATQGCVGIRAPIRQTRFEGLGQQIATRVAIAF